MFSVQLKKKLSGLTREHEALLNYVENNKHISTEKEKQKVPNIRVRLFLSSDTRVVSQF